MTDQPAFMRKALDIVVYKLGDDTIPDLVEETGLSEEQWRSVLSQDQQFGLQSKVYIVPSEVRWRALLHKYINHVAACEGTDFIDDEHGVRALGSLSPQERAMLRESKDQG